MPPDSRPPSSNGQPPSNGAPANGQPSLEDLLYPDAGRQQTSQLHELIGTLWQGKWILIGAVVLAVAAAGAYTYTIPTTYRTSNLVLVDLSSQSGMPSFGGQGGSPFFTQPQTRSLSNEVLVLRESRTIPRRVADSLLQMGSHPVTGEPLQIIRDESGNVLSERQVTFNVRSTISASQAGQSVDAIRITSTSLASREASLVANLFAEEYVARTREKSRESLQASRSFLEDQTEKLRSQVTAAERRIENYMQEEGAVALDQETQRVVSQLSQLESERSQLQIELDMKRSSLESLQEEVSRIEPKLAEQLSSSVSAELSRVQEEKAQLDAQIDRAERRNPNLTGSKKRELQRMKAKAERLEQQADSLAERYVESSLSAGGVTGGSGASEGGSSGGGRGIAYVAEKRRQIAQARIEISGLEARIGSLDNRIAELRSSMQQLPGQSMELAQLQRERRSAEQIYGFVRERLQETRISMESEMGYAEIIRTAGPGYPVAPNTRQNLLLAAMLGLVAGGGFVFLREQLDTRIHSPDDLREHGHRLIGVVPSMTDLLENEFGGEKTVQIDGRTVNTSLVMLTSPMSSAAESYRRIRTNLRFAKPDEGVRALVVSSPEKGEGKTTTATNLALSLASAGKRTILVDGDFRRPRLHRLLDRPQDPGLSQVLYEGDTDYDRFETSIENFYAIPSGDAVPNPAELLGSQRMHRFAETLRERFDYVIFDTPPVLLFSDAIGLAPSCDGTMLVARADQTDGRALDHAASLLRDVQADLIGCVLNRYDASSSFLQSYGYGYGYGYDYGYAYGYRRLSEYYDENREQERNGPLGWVRKKMKG